MSYIYMDVTGAIAREIDRASERAREKKGNIAHLGTHPSCTPQQKRDGEMR
jgi:Tat protein secretion system quality control protein TatD with DNase activity